MTMSEKEWVERFTRNKVTSENKSSRVEYTGDTNLTFKPKISKKSDKILAKKGAS